MVARLPAVEAGLDGVTEDIEDVALTAVELMKGTDVVTDFDVCDVGSTAVVVVVVAVADIAVD